MMAGCGLQTSSLGGGTPTLFIITSTLPPTPIPSITFTPIPATAAPTTAPVTGFTTTQVNVRAEPAASAAQLGLLGSGDQVRIVGRDSGGDWYEILYSAGPKGIGWVTAQYITVQNKDAIPVVGAPAETPTPSEATGTPGASGTIIQQVNVRKGPGTGFDSLGVLDPNDTAELLGKDPSGSWLQIRYSAAPDGKGWISAAYVQAADLEALAVVGETATLAAATPAASTSPANTSTPAVALQDNDSAEAPAASVVFSAAGTHALIYSSDLSSPSGDTADYVAFVPFTGDVALHLSCVGNGTLTTTLSSGGSPAPGWSGLACGQTRVVGVSPAQSYLVELSILASGNSGAYVHYTIRVDSSG